MNIAIVDDEPEAIKTLEKYISQASKELNLPIETAGFTSSESFMSAFSPGVFHIVFLDIYIDDNDGLQLAGHIRAESENTMIIFCTTSRENMPEAFRYHAFDYLVKPVSADRIKVLLSDAQKVLPSINHYLTFVSNRQEIRIPYSELVWTQSQGHYLRLKRRNGDEYTTRMTTREFMTNATGEKRFLTINKGIVVNMDRIKRIENGNCSMTDGTVFPIKVRQSARIEQLWQDYMFDQLREGQR